MACFKSLLARRIVLWYILLGSIVILPLAFNVSLGCKFVNVGFDQQDFQSLGFFNTAVYDQDHGDFLGCVSYSQFWQEQTNDIGFTIARIASGFLLTFATLATLICTFLQCFSKHGKSHLWNVMRVCYIGALVSQSVMYTIFASDMCKDDADDNISSSAAQRCVPGRNGIVGAFNILLLLLMVIATFNSFPPRNPAFQCWGSEMECDDDESDEGSTEEEDEVMRKFKAFGEGKGAEDNDSVSLFGGSRMSKKSRKSHQRSAKSKMTEDDDQISVTEKGLLNVDEEATSISSKSNKSYSSKGHKSKVSQRSQKSKSVAEKYLVTETGSLSSSKSRRSTKSSASQKSKSVPGDDVDTVESQSVSSAKSTRSKSKFLPGVAKYFATENKSVDNESVSSGSSRRIPMEPIASNSSNISVERANFIDQLVEMTDLSEGGRRVKTEERGGQLEIIDEYPKEAGEEIESTPSSDIVKIRTEYYDLGSRTTKEITHRDGSCTIVTVIVADESSVTNQREAEETPIEATGSAGTINSTNSSKYEVLERVSSETSSTIYQGRGKDKQALGQGALCLSTTNSWNTDASEISF